MCESSSDSSSDSPLGGDSTRSLVLWNLELAVGISSCSIREVSIALRTPRSRLAIKKRTNIVREGLV